MGEAKQVIARNKKAFHDYFVLDTYEAGLELFELSILEEKRGSYKKGEWLRMASLNRLPLVLPEINKSAWVELGRLSQDLNRLLTYLDGKSPDSDPTLTEMHVIKRQVQTLRTLLLPSTFWSNTNERHAENQER